MPSPFSRAYAMPQFMLLLLVMLVVASLAAVTPSCTTTSCSDNQFCNGLETCNKDGSCSPETDSSTLSTLCSSYTHARQCTKGYCNSATQKCDSWTDLSVGNPCGLSNVGACKIGTISCNQGSSSLMCSGRVDPATENGADEDCDGIVDNNKLVACSSSLDCQSSTDCMEAACASGFCRYTPKNVGELCDARGPACLGPYYCSAKGQCLARSTIACATSPYAADPTTRSECLVTTCVNGACITSRWNGPCDDKNPCTVNDACSPAGVCVGTPVACDDNDPCTADYCNSTDGGCVHTQISDCTATAAPRQIVVIQQVTTSTAGTTNPPVSVDSESSAFILVVILSVGTVFIVVLAGVVIASIVSSNKKNKRRTN